MSWIMDKTSIVWYVDQTNKFYMLIHQSIDMGGGGGQLFWKMIRYVGEWGGGLQVHVFVVLKCSCAKLLH